jgi:competence protein ComEC
MPGSSTLISNAIALLAGVLTLFVLPSLAVAGYTLIPLITGVILLACLFPPHRLILLCYLLGYVVAFQDSSSHQQDIPPVRLAGENILVRGYVEGLAERKGRALRFNFVILDEAAPGHKPISGKIRVSDYRQHPVTARPGEAWQLVLRVKPPRGFANHAGFDYEKWLFSQRITATGYVRENPENRRLLQLDRAMPIDDMRERIGHHLQAILPSTSARGLVNALATGDRREIQQSQWSILKKTGTSHLFAISGLHVGLVSGLVFLFVRLAWSQIPTLTEAVPAYKAAAVCALAFAILYSLLAGFSLPTQRALVMLMLLTLAILSDRRVSPANIVALGLAIILLANPLSVLSAGFWLSFGAVVALMLVTSMRRHGNHGATARLVTAAKVQWHLSLLLLLPVFLFFDQVPLASPLANLIAIPVISMLVVPLALLASFVFLATGTGALETSLFRLAEQVISMLWPLLETLTVPADIVPGMLAWPGMGIILLAILFMFCLRKPSLTTWMPAMVLTVAMLMPARPLLATGEFRVYLLDVGQGLSSIILTKEHAMLFDAGARFSADFNAGDAVVFPVLKDLSIRRLDRMLISHGDNDHIGGAKAVLEAIRVDLLVSNETLPGVNRQACTEGLQWDWDGVHFQVLHPASPDGASANDQSCVLRISSPYGSVLFPADIEDTAERDIVRRYYGTLSTDILIAAHHGSKTSNTGEFLDAVSPGVVLYPAGWKNRYRHPAAEVRQRVTQKGIASRVTGECGALTVDFAKPGISITAVRDESPAIWSAVKSPNECTKLIIGLPENPAL